eukprot:CAMPEP_0170625970 /NCGR_PEP_ID=MMETSP0224-20130122/31076_1 /TAXON_ID=285029 /ORGANISM="Togula jolla, Strain CCCM 725" /LENGTH=331 /DNA_ID=CAMNT_0010952647 /DNA_START=21 /DNA_END=1014 /DNA_ORIENTATION=+
MGQVFFSYCERLDIGKDDPAAGTRQVDREAKPGEQSARESLSLSGEHRSPSSYGVYGLPSDDSDWSPTSPTSSKASPSRVVGETLRPHQVATEVRRLLLDVFEENYQLRSKWKVPRTMAFSNAECEKRLASLKRDAKRTDVTFSRVSTADAMAARLAREDPSRKVCGLNFANGSHVGGGYKRGAIAQEEDLCRRIPSLFPSLLQAKTDGLYPFGPITWHSAGRPEKYSDVLFTPGLVLARNSLENDYAMLPEPEQVEVSMVTAAAPNIKRSKEVWDLALVVNAVQSIFVAPKAMQPEVTTLVLGAWGCGAFGCDPAQMGEIFAKAIGTERL